MGVVSPLVTVGEREGGLFSADEIPPSTCSLTSDSDGEYTVDGADVFVDCSEELLDSDPARAPISLGEGGII